MIINIMDYVDRYLNDYIVYYYWHFHQKYGDLQKAGLYFDMKYQQERGRMVSSAAESQAQIMVQNIRGKSPDSAAGLQVYNSLTQPGTLEKIFDEIAKALNESVDLYYQSTQNRTYDQIITEARNFETMLQKPPSMQAVNDFFSLIVEGLNQMGLVNQQLFSGLTQIGIGMTGDQNFKFNPKLSAMQRTLPVTTEEIAQVSKIIDYLSRAVERFKSASYTNSSGNLVTKSTNTLSRESFAGTITNIFNTVIGEPLARQIIQDGIKLAINTANTKIYDMFRGLGGGKNQIQLVGPEWTLGGTSRDVSNRVSKVDLFNQDAFILRVTIGNQRYDIEIGANTSVKWRSNNSKSNRINLVAGTPIGKYFKQGTPEHYLAYNIIAHEGNGGDFDAAYRTLRASTAATFFNEWISGTSGQIKGATGLVNKVQFLMINGKIKPVQTIVREVCDQLLQKDSWNIGSSPITIGFYGGPVQNKWHGKAESNIPDAMIRSKLVNAVIDRITISASIKA